MIYDTIDVLVGATIAWSSALAICCLLLLIVSYQLKVKVRGRTGTLKKADQLLILVIDCFRFLHFATLGYVAPVYVCLELFFIFVGSFMFFFFLVYLCQFVWLTFEAYSGKVDGIEVEIASRPALMKLIEETSTKIVAALPDSVELLPFDSFGISLERDKRLRTTKMIVSYHLIKDAPVLAIEYILLNEFLRSKLESFDRHNWLRRFVPKLEHISTGKKLKRLPRVLDPSFILFWPIRAMSRWLFKFTDESVKKLLQAQLDEVIEKESQRYANAFFAGRIEAFRESLAVLYRGAPEADEVKDITFSVKALNRSSWSEIAAQTTSMLPNEFSDLEPDLVNLLLARVLDEIARRHAAKGPAFLTSVMVGVGRQGRIG